MLVANTLLPRMSLRPLSSRHIRFRHLAGGLLVVCLSLMAALPGIAQQHRDAQVALADALALYNDSLYVQSYHAFERFTRAHPESAFAPVALFYRAESALLTGRHQTAQRLYRRLQERYPQHPLSRRANLHLGKRYYEAGRYSESITQLERVLDAGDGPDRTAEAYYWLGRSYGAQNRDEEAVTAFLRVAEFDDARFGAAALYAAARHQMELDRPHAAAESFEQLRRHYPASNETARIGLTLAQLYYRIGNYRAAIQEIEDQGHASVDASFLQAQAQYQLGQYDAAAAQYERVVSDASSSDLRQRAAYARAWSHYLLSEHGEAASAFARARTIGGDSLAALAGYYQAVNAQLAGQQQEAAALFSSFADRYPNHPLSARALFERGMVLAAMNEWTAARGAFDRLIDNYSQADLRKQALRVRSQIALAQGNLDAAAEDLDEALAEAGGSDESSTMQYQRAWLLLQQGAYGEAFEAFTAIREQHPTSAQNVPRALFGAAESAYQLGRLETAALLFSRYLATYPDGSEADAARYALAWTRFKQGQYGEAARLFEQFLAGYAGGDTEIPYRSDARLRLADSYFALKQYEAAIREYRRISGDGEDYARYQMAQAAANSGDLDAAASAFQQLIGAYGQSRWAPPARYQLGYVYLQQQQYERAVAAYRSLLQSNPGTALAAKAQYGIGDAYFNEGRMEEAIEAYKQVLSQYPESPLASDAASSIQYAILAIGEPERTDELITEFAQSHPNSPIVAELRFRQAEVKYESGLTDEALADFQQFVRTSENTTLLPQAYFYLGTIYAESGRLAEAENYLAQLIRQFPDSPRRMEALERLGQLYLQSEQYADALDTFRRLEAAAGAPDAGGRDGGGAPGGAPGGGESAMEISARYGQSRALLAMGRRQEAQQVLEDYLDGHPQAEEAGLIQLGLARIYEVQGRLAAAEQLYQRIVQSSRSDAGAEALYLLGMLQRSDGRLREAIETLSRMPSLFPGAGGWLARSLLAQAETFGSLGETGNAQRLYDRVVDEFTGTPFAAEARSRLQAMGDN